MVRSGGGADCFRWWEEGTLLVLFVISMRDFDACFWSICLGPVSDSSGLGGEPPHFTPSGSFGATFWPNHSFVTPLFNHPFPRFQLLWMQDDDARLAFDWGTTLNLRMTWHRWIGVVTFPRMTGSNIHRSQKQTHEAWQNSTQFLILANSMIVICFCVCLHN